MSKSEWTTRRGDTVMPTWTCDHHCNTCSFNLECPYFDESSGRNTLQGNPSLVETISEFMQNFENRFKASSWLQAIDFNSFHISGGCIVDSLCEQSPAGGLTQHVDINFNGNCFKKFDDAVNNICAQLMKSASKSDHGSNVTLVKKSNGSFTFEVDPKVQLHFHFKNAPDETNAVSYVLHSSDIDVSQVAFTGKKNAS